MNCPLISVLIPTYNYGRFISYCIDSVFKQTYKNIEVIVVDDGSVDDTREIIKQYPNVRYFYQEHKGVSAARNRLLELSQGEYIAFVDADDYWEDEKLEKQFNYLCNHKTVDMVFCICRNFFDNDCIEKNLKARFLAEKDFLAGIPSALIKKKVFEVNGDFLENLEYGEDSEWLMRVRLNGVQSARLDEILYYRRLHGDNITITKTPIGNEGYKMLVQKLREKSKKRDKS